MTHFSRNCFLRKKIETFSWKKKQFLWNCEKIGFKNIKNWTILIRTRFKSFF